MLVAILAAICFTFLSIYCFVESGSFGIACGFLFGIGAFLLMSGGINCLIEKEDEK